MHNIFADLHFNFFCGFCKQLLEIFVFLGVLKERKKKIKEEYEELDLDRNRLNSEKKQEVMRERVWCK